MATINPRPLDDALVRKLRNDLQNQGHLFTPVARAHWEAIFNHFEGRSDFEIRAYIAQNFASNHWIGTEDWFRDSYTQKVFQGYEPAEFVQSDIPALDDVARSHYNPSNTVRDYLSIWSLKSKVPQGMVATLSGRGALLRSLYMY